MIYVAVVVIWICFLEFGFAWTPSQYSYPKLSFQLYALDKNERIITHKKLKTLFRKTISVDQIDPTNRSTPSTPSKSISPKRKAKKRFVPNLGRFFSKEKNTYRSETSESFDEQNNSEAPEEDEVEKFLTEANEIVEDLTTPENLVFFQPEFDEDSPSKFRNTFNRTTSQLTSNDSDAFKSGFVSIIGNPNVGKSTLMNFLLRQKLSIVSAKPQTTRHRIQGILTEEGKYQIVFMDTPGMLYNNNAAYALHETMQSVVS